MGLAVGMQVAETAEIINNPNYSTKEKVIETAKNLIENGFSYVGAAIGAIGGSAIPIAGNIAGGITGGVVG